MPAATGAIVNNFVRTSLSQGDDWKRSKLPDGASILPRTRHGLTTKMAAKTVECNQALFMEEVQKYWCIHNKFSKNYENKYISCNSWKSIGEKFGLDGYPKSTFMSSSFSFPSLP